MFSSIGHFRTLPCPRQSECSLPICIFSHHSAGRLSEVEGSNGDAQEYDPFSPGDVPPPKKRRLDSPPREIQREAAVTAVNQLKVLGPSASDVSSPSASNSVTGSPAHGGVWKPLQRTLARPCGDDKTGSMLRPVSPPAARAAKTELQPNRNKASKPESLVPRNVAKAPALLKTRLTVLQKLHEQMKAQNSKLAGSDTAEQPLVLNDQELITFALDEEENATKHEASIYKNVVSQLIMRVKKMTAEEWIMRVSEWTGATSTVTSASKPLEDDVDLGSLGLSSMAEKVAVLKHLRTPLDGLEQYGYVTTPPSPAEIAAAQAGVTAAKGFETCDRCGTRFQVFPGRDDLGRLTSGGGCRYHWARVNRQGRSEAVYPCCNKPEGSEGCSKTDTHVFAVKVPKRLAATLQFEHTPRKTGIQDSQPISFDCEMGYTTLGMEVIRVTAVSWPTGMLRFDVFVRTYGEILDLNTRFSGVTADAYGSAMPYPSDLSERGHDYALRENDLFKVESPAAARQLLFDMISPETPIIGHAIENDLNVLRIIHPVVVDTVLLYPHPRGLPVRFSLKILSQKHLSRAIQAAGAAGHDSREDAVATGDLVTKKVADKWRMLKHEGWLFIGGILTAPEEAGSLAGGHSML